MSLAEKEKKVGEMLRFASSHLSLVRNSTPLGPPAYPVLNSNVPFICFMLKTIYVFLWVIWDFKDILFI